MFAFDGTLKSPYTNAHTEHRRERHCNLSPLLWSWRRRDQSADHAPIYTNRTFKRNCMCPPDFSGRLSRKPIGLIQLGSQLRRNNGKATLKQLVATSRSTTVAQMGTAPSSAFKISFTHRARREKQERSADPPLWGSPGCETERQVPAPPCSPPVEAPFSQKSVGIRWNLSD